MTCAKVHVTLFILGSKQRSVDFATVLVRLNGVPRSRGFRLLLIGRLCMLYRHQQTRQTKARQAFFDEWLYFYAYPSEVLVQKRTNKSDIDIVLFKYRYIMFNQTINKVVLVWRFLSVYNFRPTNCIAVRDGWISSRVPVLTYLQLFDWLEFAIENLSIPWFMSSLFLTDWIQTTQSIESFTRDGSTLEWP